MQNLTIHERLFLKFYLISKKPRLANFAAFVPKLVLYAEKTQSGIEWSATLVGSGLIVSRGARSISNYQ